MNNFEIRLIEALHTFEINIEKNNFKKKFTDGKEANINFKDEKRIVRLMNRIRVLQEKQRSLPTMLKKKTMAIIYKLYMSVYALKGDKVNYNKYKNLYNKSANFSYIKFINK
jgi:hypothetical protein